MLPIVVDSEIQLHRLGIEHAPALFGLTETNRAHLRQWLPWVDSVRMLTDTEAFIARTALTYQETKAFIAGVWWRDQLVGTIGHNRIEWDNRIGHVGYWLTADAQSRGIMTRSVRALIEHAFNKLELNRIEICCAIGNHRSEAIPLRLGFTHEGIRRHGEWLYDRFLDLNVYAMLRYRWQAAPR